MTRNIDMCRHGVNIHDECWQCGINPLSEGAEAEVLQSRIYSMQNDLDKSNSAVNDLSLQLEAAKTNAAYWEERWRQASKDLYVQCNITGKMRDKIFELTGEWLDSNMQPVDVDKLRKMYENIGSPLD